MDRGIHFISGLPRSGSTLLSAILRQNPRFSADVTSPVFHLFMTLQTAWSGKSEFHQFFDDRKRRDMLTALFDSYYADVHGEKVVFDTNRAWSTKLAALDKLFPGAKTICCVRPVEQIVDSLERLMHANALEPSRLFNFDGVNNVYSRSDALNAVPNGLVGAAFAGLREAFYGPYSHKIMVVTYETLARRPRDTLAAVYDFLGEAPFAHDFDNVQFMTPDYDRSLGLTGMHSVRGRVEFRPRENTLPPDLVKRLSTSAFWTSPQANPRRVPVI